jgi:hypothetical protein
VTTFRESLPPEIQHLYDAPGEFEFVIEKTTDSIGPGRTVSHEAVREAMAHAHDFVMAQIMRSWDVRNEPPTVVQINVKVTTN